MFEIFQIIFNWLVSAFSPTNVLIIGFGIAAILSSQTERKNYEKLREKEYEELKHDMGECHREREELSREVAELKRENDRQSLKIEQLERELENMRQTLNLILEQRLKNETHA